MNNQESHDFMAVESFSQLPFIRPNNSSSSSSPSSPSSTGSAIRLFGIDVPHDPTDSTKHSTAAAASSTSDSSSRKFECHYCCRNFPTSQALGGHQNAHKRERQHAKRAHLQSTFAAHHHQFYNLHNYHRLGTMPPAANHQYASFGTAVPPPLRLGSLSKPINGSPLPGLWRVPPAAHRDPVMPLPLFRGDGLREHAVGGGGRGSGLDDNFGAPFASSSSSSSNSPKSRLVFEPMPGVKENVSLDLHL